MDTKEVLESDAYKKAMVEAGIIAGSAIAVMQLLGKVSKRLRWLAPSFIVALALKDDLGIIVRMLRAYYDKRYTRIAYATLLKLLAAALYFTFVIDLIPDFIPVIGLLDDALVAGWVIRSAKKDIEAFLLWEQQQVVVA